MKKTLILMALLMGFHHASYAADDCNLDVHFGPVSFDNERPVAALRKILAGTGISLVESGEFDAGTITAQNVSGTVGAAVQRLAEGTGLLYACHNGVMRVSQKSHVLPTPVVTPPVTTATAPLLNMPATVTTGAAPLSLSLSIHKGDSLKAQLSAFAKINHYQVNWSGDDLFARQDVVFAGDEFEEVVNRYLQAAKITGYISNDEGKVINVFVQ